MSIKSAKRYWPAWILFATAGLISLFFLFRRKEDSPERIIRRVLTSLGLADQTAKYWVAISAFETAGWTSAVLRDTNNLFNIIVPGSKRLQRGEGQTIYATREDSVYGLYKHVLKPFRYPADAESLTALVDYMKTKNYFTSSLLDYQIGVNKWYKKLYPNEK